MICEPKTIDTTSFVNETSTVFEVLHYMTPEGKDIIDQWFDGLRDRKALLAILKRMHGSKPEISAITNFAGMVSGSCA